MTIALALYQPDIALNVGSAIRLCACLGLDLHIIEPCGFPWDPRKIRQSAMDYIDKIDVIRHNSWEDFETHRKAQNRRVILMTTKGSVGYTDFEFQDGDIILAGRESAGAPETVHTSVDGRVLIPIILPGRSLNVINASSMVIGEAIRQCTK